MHADEFVLLDQAGKARAGLGLDANDEVGIILTSKDGNRPLTPSPDDSNAITLVERGGPSAALNTVEIEWSGEGT